MITTPKNCPDAQRVFTQMGFHLAIAASFDGYWQASLLVDDAQHPHSACLMLPPRAYIAGDTRSSAFNNELAQVIRASYPPYQEALFFYDSPIWGAVLENIIAGRESINALREHYVRKSAGLDQQNFAFNGISICQVDSAFVAQSTLQNVDRLIAEIERSNPSVEAFLERCFGVCAIDGDTVVGWCLSENNTGTRCEVGIETDEAYQQQGIGTQMALALVAMAHQRGVSTLGWDCWKRNTGSSRLALTAGFRKESEYVVLLTLAK